MQKCVLIKSKSLEFPIKITFFWFRSYDPSLTLFHTLQIFAAKTFVCLSLFDTVSVNMSEYKITMYCFSMWLSASCLTHPESLSHTHTHAQMYI